MSYVTKFILIFILSHNHLISAHDPLTVEHVDKPQIPQEWIYTMIAFGFISFVLITEITIFAAYKTYHTPRRLLTTHTKRLTGLLFSLWICNAIATCMWAFTRTDLFIRLNPRRCTVIYITNYLFYMFAKYFLHIILIYRLFIAFKGSQYNLQMKSFIGLIVFISINFIVFSSLWMKTCIENVTIGITVDDLKLNVCTLFNNDSDQNMSTFHKIWPTLLGAQDLIIGLITLTLFIYKTYKVSVNPFMAQKDPGMELVIRRLLICGTSAVLSTFLFYTFAIPFYGNLTFLLPFDALINSFSVLLMITYGKKIYMTLCCGCDRCCVRLLKHETVNQRELEMQADIGSRSPNSGHVSTPEHIPSKTEATLTINDKEDKHSTSAPEIQ